MATVEELLGAAANADAAGDAQAAQMLVRQAEAMMGQAPAKAVSQPNTDATTGLPMGVAPPRADAPAEVSQPRQDRFGDTVQAAMAGPIAATKTFAGGLADQSKSPTMAALPEGIPFKRQIAAVGDLGGAALSGLGVGIAGAAGLVGETFGGSPTNEVKLARDLLMGAQVAVPELAGVSSTVRAAGGAARGAQTLQKPATPSQASARAAGDLGITPSLGMTGKTGAMAAAALEKVPFAATKIAKDAERAVGEIESVFKSNVARTGGAVSPDAAGSALQSGLRVAVKAFETRSKYLFDKVAERLPKGAKVYLSATTAAIGRTKEYFANNPLLAQKLGLNEWDGVIAEAGKNGISWQAVRQLRTQIGEAIGTNRGALKDEDIGRLKAIYGALTEDMGKTAERIGGGAFGTWKAANNHYKSGATRIERSLDKTISAENPERAFEAFTALTKADRASSDVFRMREIKAALPEDDWNTVSASIVDRLGRARTGQQNADGDAFSPATFLTEWNKMSEEAKRILLPEDVRLELGQLAKVAERAKAGGAERNASNTGTVVVGAAALTNALYAPVTTAAVMGGLNISAKALTSSTFLSAVNRAARGDQRAIAAMAKGSGAFTMDAKEILRLMATDAAATTPANNARAPVRIAN